jgi:hypothetical protein
MLPKDHSLQKNDIIEFAEFVVKQKKLGSGKEVPIIVVKERPRLIKGAAKDAVKQIGEPVLFTHERFRADQLKSQDGHDSSKSTPDKNQEETKESRDSVQDDLIRVADLSNSIATTWQIRARINKKHNIVRHKNGALFKIDLIDDMDNQTMIEGTFYTEETEYWYTQIE